jgi:hypothetical protein
MSIDLDDTTPCDAGFPDVPRQVQQLRDRQEVVDALYRFGAGQDLRDRELFLSAFAPEAVLDFTQPASRFGAAVPVMHGRGAIEGILTTLEPLATTHTVTNPRVVLDGDRARLWALVEAQHVLRAQPHRRLLLKNTYDVDLVRRDGVWVVTAMTIRTVWSDGDASVLFGNGREPGSDSSTPAKERRSTP